MVPGTKTLSALHPESGADLAMTIESLPALSKERLKDALASHDPGGLNSRTQSYLSEDHDFSIPTRTGWTMGLPSHDHPSKAFSPVPFTQTPMTVLQPVWVGSWGCRSGVQLPPLLLQSQQLSSVKLLINNMAQHCCSGTQRELSTMGLFSQLNLIKVSTDGWNPRAPHHPKPVSASPESRFPHQVPPP